MSSKIHMNGKRPLRRSHLDPIQQILCLASTASLESGFAIFRGSNQQCILAAYKRAKCLLTELSDRLGYPLASGERGNARLVTTEATHEPH